MKNFSNFIIASILGATSLLFNSCGALISSSDDGTMSYYAGSTWAPYPPGAPNIYPSYYWNSDLYPGAYLPGTTIYPPAYRPAYRPSISVNRPSGNVRPGYNQNAGISTLPDKIPVNERPSQSITPSSPIPSQQITGGMPGIAMPSGNSELRPTGRH
ncbi:MAG: hypothetical protein K2M94_04840 [Paramuribaculum sp.]|nr:hypothetical protein [Paramuribaculum sp.]